jgi:uncharacterized DUF497 family protein
MKERLANFEWDEMKAALNFKKHGVRFEDAAETFFDEDFIRLFDEKHSEVEIRYAGTGKHPSGIILVTIYTERGDMIRIISSRKANKKERQLYENSKRS